MDTPAFIFVDDDNLVHIYSRMLVRKTLGEAVVKNFLQPEEALEFLQHGLQHLKEHPPVLLFLDINMPTMDGWEFLEHYRSLSHLVGNCIRIFILSSSVDDRDKDRAALIPEVEGYLVKPLSKDVFLSLLPATARPSAQPLGWSRGNQPSLRAGRLELPTAQGAPLRARGHCESRLAEPL